MAEGKRFKTFCTDADTNTWQKEAVPKNTRKHTSWGVNVYVDWARSRNENSKDFEPENLKYPYAPDDLSSLSVEEINYWLSKFCVDVRQRNGEEYRHEVLYSLFCAINRVIRESKPGLVLFKSPELKPLQNVLDGRLKYLQSKQDPFRKKASAVSENDEEKLWLSGALGTHSPRVLLDTLVFMVGKIFALRGGDEHRNLCRDSFEFCRRDDGQTVVNYREKTSKVNQGGLKRRKIRPKAVSHIENADHPRAFMHIFNFYISKW
jgi:hypothetical protein